MSKTTTVYGWYMTATSDSISGKQPISHLYWVAPTAPAGTRCLACDVNSEIIYDAYSAGSNDILPPFPVKAFVTGLYPHTMAYGTLYVYKGRADDMVVNFS